MASQNVVATYDGDTMQLYHEGALAETTSGAGMVLDQSRPLLIGARSDDGSANAFFSGSIDDVRFYNRVLSEAEIAGLSGMTKPFDKPL